jgi:hypothetical protein
MGMASLECPHSHARASRARTVHCLVSSYHKYMFWVALVNNNV